MNTTEVKVAKYTAVLVHEMTKEQIVSIREESNLSEKDIMAKLISFALLHKDEILEEAKKEVEAYEIEKEAKRVAAYEQFKIDSKMARAAARIARADRKTAAAVVVAAPTEEVAAEANADVTSAEEPINADDVGSIA